MAVLVEESLKHIKRALEIDPNGKTNQLFFFNF